MYYSMYSTCSLSLLSFIPPPLRQQLPRCAKKLSPYYRKGNNKKVNCRVQPQPLDNNNDEMLPSYKAGDTYEKKT